jgi:hypothetical protein
MRVPREISKAVVGARPAAALVDPEMNHDKPSLANPVRKRCVNCGKIMTVTRSYQRFCRAACRKQFFEYNNTAFGAVKHMVERIMRAQQKEIELLRRRVEELENVKAQGSYLTLPDPAYIVR